MTVCPECGIVEVPDYYPARPCRDCEPAVTRRQVDERATVIARYKRAVEDGAEQTASAALREIRGYDRNYADELERAVKARLQEQSARGGARRTKDL